MNNCPMSITAMKHALEELEEINKLSIGEGAICLPAEIDDAMDALRQAIEQAEKQEQGEPVGWIDNEGNMICTKINESCKPLYTTPQQRTWVGLTNKEIDKIRNTLTLMSVEGRANFSIYTYARAIEAKLKEKNT
jgi:hypothetical protein